MEFEAGQLVKHVTGGPEMVVTKVVTGAPEEQKGNGVYTRWFSLYHRDFRSERFMPEELVPFED